MTTLTTPSGLPARRSRAWMHYPIVLLPHLVFSLLQCLETSDPGLYRRIGTYDATTVNDLFCVVIALGVPILVFLLRPRTPWRLFAAAVTGTFIVFLAFIAWPPPTGPEYALYKPTPAVTVFLVLYVPFAVTVVAALWIIYCGPVTWLLQALKKSRLGPTRARVGVLVVSCAALLCAPAVGSAVPCAGSLALVGTYAKDAHVAVPSSATVVREDARLFRIRTTESSRGLPIYGDSKTTIALESPLSCDGKGLDITHPWWSSFDATLRYYRDGEMYYATTEVNDSGPGATPQPPQRVVIVAFRLLPPGPLRGLRRYGWPFALLGGTALILAYARRQLAVACRLVPSLPIESPYRKPRKKRALRPWRPFVWRASVAFSVACVSLLASAYVLVQALRGML